MAKVKAKSGYRFIKELGGAVRRAEVSTTARVLVERRLIQGRVLDYGCGFGFDADHFGWESFDPYYRPKPPVGPFDTIVCNHVAHMLTRASRTALFESIDALLAPAGVAFIAVTRSIPTIGKASLRKRIQNYVELSLPSVYRDEQIEIYRLNKGEQFEDLTREFEQRM